MTTKMDERLPSNLRDHLTKEADYHRINELGRIVFTQGNHDRMEEFVEEILPLVNMAYHQHLKSLDDRRYSYEDLIQDSIVVLYRDITLRWDKLVNIFDYFSYFKTICRNVMLSVVHGYHNYYSHNELDPDAHVAKASHHDYNEVDTRLTKIQVEDAVIKTMMRLVACRIKHRKAFNYIIKYRYIKKESTETIRNSLRVLGVSRNLMNFMFDHLTYISRLAYNYQRVVLDNNMEEIARFEEIFSRFEEPTYRILAGNYFDTILPEFFAEFGPENTKKFVKLFGGKTINLPDYQQISDDLMGGILINLTGGNKDKLYAVSQSYNLRYSQMTRIMNRVESYI
jgi:hypothetical protein